MINEIKFNNGSALLDIRPIEKEGYQNNPKEEDKITIKNDLKKYIDFLMVDEPSTEDSDSRIHAIKEQIQSNQFRIDVDALSDKLFTQFFSKEMDI